MSGKTHIFIHQLANGEQVRVECEPTKVGCIDGRAYISEFSNVREEFEAWAELTLRTLWVLTFEGKCGDKFEKHMIDTMLNHINSKNNATKQGTYIHPLLRFLRSATQRITHT